jgi:hypothetical protein
MIKHTKNTRNIDTIENIYNGNVLCRIITAKYFKLATPLNMKQYIILLFSNFSCTIVGRGSSCGLFFVTIELLIWPV